MKRWISKLSAEYKLKLGNFKKAVADPELKVGTEIISSEFWVNY
jgi:hypothetical protein